MLYLLSHAAGTPPPNNKDKQYWKHVEAVGAKTSPSLRVTVYDSVGYPQQSRFVYEYRKIILRTKNLYDLSQLHSS